MFIFNYTIKIIRHLSFLNIYKKGFVSVSCRLRHILFTWEEKSTWLELIISRIGVNLEILCSDVTRYCYTHELIDPCNLYCQSYREVMFFSFFSQVLHVLHIFLVQSMFTVCPSFQHLSGHSLNFIRCRSKLPMWTEITSYVIITTSVNI
jgi:hypothetical protein